jgi:hypothetical protein
MFLLVLLLPGLLLQSALAAPKARLWDVWQASAQRPGTAPDPAPWEAFLQRRVHAASDGINRVDYAGVTAGEHANLRAYLDQLQATRVSTLDKRQQKAYWINLYNAGTVWVILQHYPVTSIRDIDISPGLFSDGPWGKKLFTIEGRKVSLDDIEHRILRPIWRDNRLHYALNCASLGCPNLQRTAFTADNTEQLLEQAAREYINHPRGARVNNGALHVSSIYHWFEDDFGSSEQGVIRHLKRYAEPPLKRQLQGIDEIEDHDYDWSLNDLRHS